MPLLPKASFAITKAVRDPIRLEQPEAVATIDTSSNRLIIPSIRLEEQVVVGDNPKLVHKGVWHRPHTALPGEGSNTVLVGHRFTYSHEAVFYNLDQVKTGELLALTWEGKLYTYRVASTSIVSPSETSIEQPTDEETLTIYTCHPLWSVKQRLVVTAVLESVQ